MRVHVVIYGNPVETAATARCLSEGGIKASYYTKASTPLPRAGTGDVVVQSLEARVQLQALIYRLHAANTIPVPVVLAAGSRTTWDFAGKLATEIRALLAG